MKPSDPRLNKLNINFPGYWSPMENPNGGLTFVDSRSDEPGVLQMNLHEYKSGPLPNPSQADLMNMTRNIGVKNNFGTLVREESGTCGYGLFGRADFSSAKFPLFSVWYLSDSRNFILATFICSKTPEPTEIKDVCEILTTITSRT